MPTNVMVVGSGGREHALLWKLSLSPRVGKLFAAPGNGGTSEIAENVPIEARNVPALAEFAERNAVDLTLVGSEEPLFLGIAEEFAQRDLRIFAPTSGAARIEGSKTFAKELMLGAGIPTASFRSFVDFMEAVAFVRRNEGPCVVKASGPASGKGVFVCKNSREAEQALRTVMRDLREEAVVEEFLEGTELSLHAISDGAVFKLFPPAQDHKRIGDGDTGKNTGGMGAIAPVPGVSEQLLREAEEQIVRPVFQRLADGRTPFAGCLYPGLMVTSQGPRALEYNARFGDPETQAYMLLLRTDLLDILDACTEYRLLGVPIRWNSGYAVCVVLASRGYPDRYEPGHPITGIEEAERIPDVAVFHAGTVLERGILKTSGGRVLGVTARGRTLQEAISKAYEAALCIRFEGMHYRRDIGLKSLILQGDS